MMGKGGMMGADAIVEVVAGAGLAQWRRFAAFGRLI